MSDGLGQGPIRIGVEVLETGLRAVCLSEKSEILESIAFGPHAPESASIDFAKSASERHGSIGAVGLASVPESEAATVSISNDFLKISGSKPFSGSSAVCGVVGESKAGAGVGAENLFYFTLGSPVCGALVLGGRVWHGSSGVPCEFGSIVIDSEGRNVLDFATDESILRRTRNRFHQDQTSSLVALEESAITVEDIISEALKGDDFAKMMLERTGRFAGKAVAAAINLLNLDRIVVGGAVMAEGTSAIDGVIAGAKENSASASFESVSIVPAGLGVFSAAVGAAILAGGD